MPMPDQKRIWMASLLELVILSCSAAFAQKIAVAYNGKTITATEFSKFSFEDKMAFVAALQKDQKTIDMFLFQCTPDELDSVVVAGKKYILALEKEGPSQGLTQEEITKRAEQYRGGIRAIRSFDVRRDNMLPPTDKERDDAEKIFLKNTLEGKLAFLALQANNQALFDKFYVLLTPSEKNRSQETLDGMIADLKTHGKELGLTQSMIDKEVAKNSALKERLLGLQKKN
jgi:hypothetical protein